MALMNDAKKEIHAKIVYLGPKGAGKATALRFIYSRLKADCRSELKSLASGDHEMLFFDFSYPLPRRSDGYTIRFHIYTLSSSGEAPPPWKMLLKGADGVVLFADSTEGRMYGNLECCALLFDSLAHYGLKRDDITLSLQCNKRDLNEAVPLAIMKKELLPEGELEGLPVCATSGTGLLEGLNISIKGILQKLGGDDTALADAAGASAPLTAEDRDRAGDSLSEHCSGEKPGFEVVVTGMPLAVDGTTVVIPLSLKGGECGRTIDFKVTVSVSL